MERAAGEGLGHAAGMDRKRGEARGAVQGAQVDREHRVAGDRRHPRAVDCGADEAARIAQRPEQALLGPGQGEAAGAAVAERVRFHLEEIGHVQRSLVTVRASVARPRVPQVDPENARHRERESGVPGPAREPVGLGLAGLLQHGHAEIGEEGEVDVVRHVRRPRGVVRAIGHERGADAAVGKIEPCRQRIPLALHPGVRIGCVLEGRRSAMQGDDVGSRPRARFGIGERSVGLRLRLTHPCAQRMADLVGERREQGGIAGFSRILPQVVPVDFEGRKAGLP